MRLLFFIDESIRSFSFKKISRTNGRLDAHTDAQTRQNQYALQLFKEVGSIKTSGKYKEKVYMRLSISFSIVWTKKKTIDVNIMAPPNIQNEQSLHLESM